MARNQNHFIGGRKVTASKSSYWGPEMIVSYVRDLKVQDPGMVVDLYPADFRDALRAALEAAGMRWHFIDADELERIRAQRRAEMQRIQAERDDEWRRTCALNRDGLERRRDQEPSAFELAFAYMRAEAERLRSVT